MSRKDSRETTPVKRSGNQMFRCVECDQFFPTQKTANELVQADGVSGGCCPNCGNDEFEPVVLDPERD